jgi:hypothetical protein
MEKLLNLIWLLLALAVLCAWLRHRQRVQRGPYPARMIWQVLALSIVLIFLFYAISITDDLNWNVMAAEASEGSQKLLKSVVSTNATTSAGIWLFALLVAAVCLNGMRQLRRFEPWYSIGSPDHGSRQNLSGRSPPFAA